MSSLIPASLAKANSHITSASDTGDKLFCMDVITEKADSLESIAEEVNTANNGWEAQVPEKFESFVRARSGETVANQKPNCTSLLLVLSFLTSTFVSTFPETHIAVP